MKKILLIILLIIVLAFVVHWTGIPVGTYVDMALEKIFAWTTSFIPRLTELVPKWGAKIKESISSFLN